MLNYSENHLPTNLTLMVLCGIFKNEAVLNFSFNCGGTETSGIVIKSCNQEGYSP